MILEDVDKAAGEDYINASFIDGYYNRVEFIATQHPIPTTRADLWRMILERDVNTLVVIGALEDDYVCETDYRICFPFLFTYLFIEIGWKLWLSFNSAAQCCAYYSVLGVFLCK